MRVAVVGAGIVGVTTAYELARDGHQVAVFERRATVATEASFANAGLVAPDAAAVARGVTSRVLRPLEAGGHDVGWRQPWRWWRRRDTGDARASHADLHWLAVFSRSRLRSLADELRIDYERADGLLVVLRTAREVERMHKALDAFDRTGARPALLDRDACLRVEPGLSRDTPLAGGLHWPDDGVGNCRRFAQQLRRQAQDLDVRWHFGSEVLALHPSARPSLEWRPVEGIGPGPVQRLEVDAVVLAAGLGTLPLLAQNGLRLPMVAVHGYSVTAPLRQVEGHPDVGPRAALWDAHHGVTVSRLGLRVRVAGGVERRGLPQEVRASKVATLHRVLDDWFPGAAQMSQAQVWKGARPSLADGRPLVGPSGLPGVWLNVGHGAQGWGLACGSARLLADRMGGRATDLEIDAFGVERLAMRHRRV